MLPKVKFTEILREFLATIGFPARVVTLQPSDVPSGCVGGRSERNHGKSGSASCF